MVRADYIILGNGLNSKVCPAGFKTDDMRGHTQSTWSQSDYSIESIVEDYIQKIPANACVWGHSLGGHIAINVALKRSDIEVINFGMVPIEGVESFGTIMTPVPEFTDFQKAQRSDDDLRGFLNYSALGNESVMQQLISCAREQDPSFNQTFFTTGLANYAWGEVTKAQSLGERFTLIVSQNEAIYNYELMMRLPLRVLNFNYAGHTPWLLNDAWFETVRKLVRAGNFTGVESVSTL